jgi:hypothetical protein
MALIQRNATPAAPQLPRETVAVEELGGDVIVRGMLLSDRMEQQALAAAMADARDGETKDQALHRTGREIVFFTLSRCVVLEDDLPMWTAAEWDRFGGKHTTAALSLYRKARQLCGYDEEQNEKN